MAVKYHYNTEINPFNLTIKIIILIIGQLTEPRNIPDVITKALNKRNL